MATGPLTKEDRILGPDLRGPFGGYKAYLRGDITWAEAEATIPHAGIYQVRRVNGKKIPYKLKFYRPTNPQTVNQQSRRAVFADGIIHWRALTSDEKKSLNIRARRVRMSGYNLYLREYMLSH